MNLVRYHGVFAPHFAERDKIVKRPRAAKNKEKSSGGSERLRWADMLKRVFKIDVLICPKCQGRLEQIAVIKDKAVAAKILASLGEKTEFNPLHAGPRGPPHVTSEDFIDELDQRLSW